MRARPDFRPVVVSSRAGTRLLCLPTRPSVRLVDVLVEPQVGIDEAGGEDAVHGGRPGAQRRASKVGIRVRAARASSTRRTGVWWGYSAIAPLGLGGGLVGDALERLGQGLEGLGALGLGGLDHQGLVHDEREVDGRGVEALLQQALGHVEGPHPVGLLEGPADSTTSCMHGRSKGTS